MRDRCWAITTWLRIKNKFLWLTDSTWVLLMYLWAFTLLVCLVSWHTEQAICYVTDMGHLYGTPYLIMGVLGAVMLIHEAEHIWKHKWMKVPIGILSVYFIYYCFLDALWLLADTVLKLPIVVSAYGTLFLCAAAAVLVIIGYQNTKRIHRTLYRITLRNTGRTYRIALISDLHLGAFVGVDHVKRIVAAVNDLQADLIIIAGDMIDEDNSVLSDPDELKRIACELQQLRSRYGAVLTLGNHDPDAADPAFLSFLDRCHIRMLHNQSMELPAVNVIGISDPTHNKRIPIGTLLAYRNHTKPTIVVDHDPRYMDAAVEQNADLVLSGHTHAGQFFPASVLTRIALGKQRFYGHHIIGKTNTVVTSGAGFFNLPVRIGTSNEVVLLNISL